MKSRHIIAWIVLLLSTIVLRAQNREIPALLRVSGPMPQQGSCMADFSIYEEQSSDKALWSETQWIMAGRDGDYHIVLGSASRDGVPLSLFAAGRARWLGVRCHGEEERPRTRLLSVAYAMKAGDAETLGGLPASAFARADAVASAQDRLATLADRVYVNTTQAVANASVTAANPNAYSLAKFNDATGALGNSLIYDNGSGNIGIGTNNPITTLHLVGSMPYVRIETYSDNPPNIKMLMAHGTQSAPTNVKLGESIGQINAHGYGTTKFSDTSRIKLNFIATENWTDTAQGTAMLMFTTANGSSTPYERMRVDSSGYVGVGTNAPTYPLSVVGKIQSAVGGFVFPDGTLQTTAATTTAQLTAADGTLNISNNAIKIASGGVASAQLAASAVATNNIADASVTSAKIASSAVTTSNLADASVTTAKLAGSSVTSAKLASSAVTTSNIADAAVTSAKIAGSAVTTSNLADASVTSAKLGADVASTLATLQSALGTTVTLSANTFASTQTVSMSDANNAALNGYNNSLTGTAWGLRGVTTSVAGTGVYGLMNTTSGSGYGVSGVALADQGVGVYGEASNANGVNYGMMGQTRSQYGYGIMGRALATTGSTHAVQGENQSASASAVGVYGVTTNTTSYSGVQYGVQGVANNPYGVGVYGYSSFTGLSATTIGVLGTVNNTQGTAGQFNNLAGGDVLRGYAGGGKVFHFDGSGNLYLKGTVMTGSADFAELLRSAPSPRAYEPGDVLEIDADQDRTTRLSSGAYSTRVLGVYSTLPGVLGTPHAMEAARDGELPVAMLGVVPCKASAENGAIARGDLLVTAETPGRVMKATDRSRMVGAIVGKALQPLDKGEGVILIAVMLQ